MVRRGHLKQFFGGLSIPVCRGPQIYGLFGFNPLTISYFVLLFNLITLLSTHRSQMAKKNHIRTVDSIPLPEVLRDALIEIPEVYPYVSPGCYPHVSRTVNHLAPVEITEQKKGGKKVKKTIIKYVRESVEHVDAAPLTSSNSQFYIGTMFRKLNQRLIFKLLGWKIKSEEKEGLYNEDFIEASLAYLFEHAKKGEKVRWVIGRYLSELFNGKTHTQEALSAEEEIDLVQRIAKNKFPEKAKMLEIILVEDMPEHHALFKYLREANMDYQNFATPPGPLPTPPTSLDIAHHLYFAAQENRMVCLRINGMVPDPAVKAVDQIQTSSMYAIIELATRLMDLDLGTTIQGGANRQSVYDEFIANITQGPKGRLRGVPELIDLLTHFEGTRFETVHVDNQINPPVLRRIRGAARNRIAMVALSLAAIVGGGVKAGQVHEQNEQAARQAQLQAAMDDSIEERMADVTFYWDYKWAGNGEHNAEMFHSIVEKILIHIQLRYNIPKTKLSELKIALEEFVITDIEGSTVCSLDKEIPKQIQLADEFVRKRKYLFVAKGIEIQYPYEHLEKYVHLFDKTQEEHLSQYSNDNPPPDSACERTCDSTYGLGGGLHLTTFNNSHLKIIGHFKTGQGYGSDQLYELVEYTDDNGEKYLLASEDNPYVFGRNITYNSSTASEFVCHYMKEKQLHEANKFWDQTMYWGDLNPKYGRAYLPEFAVEEREADFRLKKLGTFLVHPSGIELEIAKNTHFMGNDKHDHVSLVARRLGDKGPFTTQVAMEAAYYYREAQDKRWKRGNFCEKSSEDGRKAAK